MSESEGKSTPEYTFDDYSDAEPYTESQVDGQLNTNDDPEIPIYETITAAEISEKTLAQVQAVKNVLPDDIQITNNALRFLLNKQRWDIEGTCERILLDSDNFLIMNNLTRTEPTDSENTTIPTTCSVCFDDEIPLTTNPNCKSHFYCEFCYSYQVYTKITTEGLTDDIECIHPKCSVVLEPSFTENLLKIGEKYHNKSITEKAKEQYNRFILNSTITNNPQFKSCCTKGCDQMFWLISHRKALELKVNSFSGVLNKTTFVRAAEHDETDLLEPEHLKLICEKCEGETCFSCGLSYHYPATCDQVKKWEEKSKDDSETKNWLEANTKPCPKCNTLIEKNSGCNHMTCRKAECRYEFCWLCLQHTTSHLGHANCDQEAHKQMQESAASSKQKLDRYLTYFTHYNAHRNSLVKIDRVNTSIEHLMKKMLKWDSKSQNSENSTNSKNSSNSTTPISLNTLETDHHPYANFQDKNSLNSAVECLIQCRKTLQHVYIFAYFIHFIENTDSKIFELNLENLNNSIEQLSNMLENELRLKYEKDKQKIAALSIQKFGFEVSPEQYKKLQKVSPFPEEGKIMKKANMDHNNYRQFMQLMQEFDGAHRFDPFVDMRLLNGGIGGARSGSKRKRSGKHGNNYTPVKVGNDNFHEFCLSIRAQEKFCRERLDVVLRHIEYGFRSNLWMKKVILQENIQENGKENENENRLTPQGIRQNNSFEFQMETMRRQIRQEQRNQVNLNRLLQLN